MARKSNGSTTPKSPPEAEPPPFDGSSFGHLVPDEWKLTPHPQSVTLLMVQLETEGDSPVPGTHYTDCVVTRCHSPGNYDARGGTYFINVARMNLHVCPTTDPKAIRDVFRLLTGDDDTVPLGEAEAAFASEPVTTLLT